MPRKAREKDSQAIYHIMCRSLSELLLFRDDEDKDYYLALLKRYIDKFKCSIYAFCLMDTHLHIHFDPKGYDISKFMHCLNTAYVRYYNKKYERHGHLFQGRFESKILDTDRYNLAVSAYIHNNPKDIDGYEGREEHYTYSSYGIYLGIRKDTHGLIDKGFIRSLFNSKNRNKFIEEYYYFVSSQRDIDSFKEIKEYLSSDAENEYISGREIILREVPPSKVISYISEKLMIPEKIGIITKGSRHLHNYRAFSAYVLRVLCGLGYKEICSNIYNITISGCHRLCNKGYELCKDETLPYRNVFDQLVSCEV